MWWNNVLEMDTYGKYIKWCVSLVIFHVLRCFTLLSVFKQTSTQPFLMAKIKKSPEKYKYIVLANHNSFHTCFYI